MKMHKNTTKSLAVFVLAVVLVVGASVGAAWAYFTTYARALGSRQISLKDTTTIIERFDETYKHKYVRIRNNADSAQPVYVRVAAFVGTTGTKGKLTINRGNWTLPEAPELNAAEGAYGYYYYPEPLLPGSTTEGDLDIEIELPELTDLPENLNIEDDLGVVVIYESTPVLYSGNDQGTGYGTPVAANGPDYVGWSLRTDQVTNKTPDTTEGGN